MRSLKLTYTRLRELLRPVLWMRAGSARSASSYVSWRHHSSVESPPCPCKQFPAVRDCKWPLQTGRNSRRLPECTAKSIPECPKSSAIYRGMPITRGPRWHPLMGSTNNTSNFGGRKCIHLFALKGWVQKVPTTKDDCRNDSFRQGRRYTNYTKTARNCV